MQVRDYQPADRDACVAICQRCIPRFVAATELVEFVSFLYRYRQWDCRYGVLEDPGLGIVGCGGVAFLAEKRAATLCWGLLDPRHHRRGFGTFLLQTRLVWAAERPDIDRVELDTSQHTFGFFERFGFEVTGVTQDHYAAGLHRYDMVLHLEPDVRQRLLDAPGGGFVP